MSTVLVKGGCAVSIDVFEDRIQEEAHILLSQELVCMQRREVSCLQGVWQSGAVSLEGRGISTQVHAVYVTPHHDVEYTIVIMNDVFGDRYKLYTGHNSS